MSELLKKSDEGVTHVTVAVEGGRDGVGEPVEAEGLEDRVERRVVV
jgi:hypothetical protein